jgi:putative membrane protein
MKKRSLLDYATLSLKGMAMGAVEFLPGISGGTIAFVVGVYEELINTIKGALPAFKQLFGKKTFSKRITDFWTALNGNFIVALILGIVVAAGLTVVAVKSMLKQYPIIFYAFVFGLIIASVVLVYKKVSKWTLVCYLLGAVGVGLALLLPAQPNSGQAIVPLWYFFICACLASCAYILPGTSGTFVLLLMGAYPTLINAMHPPFEVPYIIMFVLGCLTGLIAFSNFLSWLLKKYHDLTVALLTGFIVGSLKIIWPWKASTTFSINAQGVPFPNVPQNVFPAAYELNTTFPAMTKEAILACVFGVVLVLGIELAAKMFSKKVA